MGVTEEILAAFCRYSGLSLDVPRMARQVRAKIEHTNVYTDELERITMEAHKNYVLKFTSKVLYGGHYYWYIKMYRSFWSRFPAAEIQETRNINTCETTLQVVFNSTAWTGR